MGKRTEGRGRTEEGRGGKGREMREGMGVEEKGEKGRGKEGETRQTGGEGKDVSLIALCDKYHPG